MNIRPAVLFSLVALAAFVPGRAESPLQTSRVPTRTQVAARLSVCVFCGASDQVAPKYAVAAQRLGEGIAARHWTLVYGGSRTGLMGAVARGAKDSGGRVVAVLPRFIQGWGVAYESADELMTVTTMHERKLLLQARADAFVVLPGGSGTLDELADTLELDQLNLLGKPLIILNQDGYYDGLLAFLDRAISEKFSRDDLRQKIQVVRTLDEALGMLERLPGTSFARGAQ